MINSCHRASRLLHQLVTMETDDILKAALGQMVQTVASHEKILSAKMKQLNESSSQCKEEKKPMMQSKRLSPNKHKREMVLGDNKDDLQKRQRRDAIEDTIISGTKITFNDVAGLMEAKQALKEAIIIPLEFPHLFTGGRQPWKRILLYGPPGTGKSRLAQAVASEIKSTFYCVSSSDLISSWVGESEKLIKELFTHAMSQEGRSVIFIDEIDSICRQRSSREEEHTRRVKTELLRQMEGADNADIVDHIFLLCATNCPWELDTAFLRRFQKRIYIPLPDREVRVQLMKIHCKDAEVEMDGADWEKLAEVTELYSGSDLASLILDGLFQPIRQLQATLHWIYNQDDMIVPAKSPDQTGAFSASLVDLPPAKVMPRKVTLEDFCKSLSMHRNTITPEELKRFDSFTTTFGQNG